jgi:hypothetical protein
MSTATTAGYVFVTVENQHPKPRTDPTETALYQWDPENYQYKLITSENGEATSIREVIRTFGARIRYARNIFHLRPGGQWMTSVPEHLMVESTPIQRIEAEIADLRAEANRLEEIARFSDDRHSGYMHLRDRADAMQHVLDVLAATDDD